MEEYTFPPAANWYRSKIISCAEDGTIAYGSRGHIIILKPNQDTESPPFKYSIFYNAHREKINAVVFSPSTNSKDKYFKWLCSASDDSQVKVWNVETEMPVLVNCTHGEGQKINCLDWSMADPNLIVSVDDSHKIVLWDIFSNTTRHLIINKISAFTVACCPHDAKTVAIGSTSGLVYIISTKGKVLHRLRGHDTEVISLAWCPVPYNVLQPPENRNSNNEILLASAAKGKLVYLWKAIGDGKYEYVLAIPQPLAAQPHRSKMATNYGSSVSWVSIAWPEASTIYVGSTCGELLKADLNYILSAKLRSSKSEKPSNNMWSLVHAEHSRGIFTVACCPKYWAPMYKDTEVKNNEEVETKPASNGYEECIAGNDAIKTENAQALSKEKRVIWTTSHDTQLIGYDWHSEKASIFSLNGGYVYCIAQSPLDANRLAFALGDGTIRIWNVGAQNKYKTTSLWQKVGGKVMVLAWHPQKEGLLAYGTSEGRIGIYNILNQKAPIIFRTGHHCVYTLFWAPPLDQKVIPKSGLLQRNSFNSLPSSIKELQMNENKFRSELKIAHTFYTEEEFIQSKNTVQQSSRSETNFHLIACSQRELLQYNPNAPEEEPFYLNKRLKASDLNSKKETKRSDCSWKPDQKYLAVGNEDGTVQIYSLPDLKLRQTLLAHKRMIQCLKWHPESTVVDTGYSPFRNWLATSSNDNFIKVYDLTKLVKNEDYVENENGLNNYSLHGHSARVVCINWNPHIGGILVSTSYDGTARIWNVPAQETIAIFSDQSGCLLTCIWSPLNPDLILSGSSDFTVRIWRVSNQKSTPVERRKPKKLTGSKIAKPPVQDNLENQPTFHTKSIDNDLQESWRKNNCTDNVADKSDVRTAEELQMRRNMAERRRPTSKTFFPVSFNRDRTLENCYVLLEAMDKKNAADKHDSKNQASFSDDQELEDISKEQELSVMNVALQDRNAMHELIDLEVAELQKNRPHSEPMQQMLLWKGNVTEMLREAARRKRLDDWMVSLAPMASQKVWLEMCSAYAEQLAEHGYYHKASTYLLACHKVEEAIELLASNNLYREAIVIAKCRLGPEDPLLNDLISEWRCHEEMNGSFEAAASCYILLGRLPEAVQCLRKRTNSESLKCGAFIARKAEMYNVAAELANKSVYQCLLDGESDLAAEVAEEHPELKHLKLLLSAHRKTMELVYLNEGPKTFEEFVAWIKGTANNTPVVSILQLINEHWDAELYKDNLEQVYTALEKMLGINETVDSREKLWFSMSRGFALACLSSDERRYHHICSVLNTCYQYIMLHPKEQHFLLCLCIWLSPQGPSAAGSVFSASDSEHPKGIFRSLRAYLCAALLEWLAKPFENKDANLQTSNCDRECPNTNEEYAEQWIIPLEFFKSYRDDIMSLECVQYFQDCVKIKKLEKDVAEYITKAKQSSAVSGTSIPDPEKNDNELAQNSVPDPQMNDNELAQDSAPDPERNDNELAQNSVRDPERNDNGLAQNSVPNPERNDNGLAQNSVPDLERNDNGLPQTSVPDSEKNDVKLPQTEDKNSNDVLETFQELKMRKENFEQLYLSSPNPFITYCKLKSALERAAEYQTLLTSNLLNDFELAWKHIMEVTSVN